MQSLWPPGQVAQQELRQAHKRASASHAGPTSPAPIAADSADAADAAAAPVSQASVPVAALALPPAAPLPAAASPLPAPRSAVCKVQWAACIRCMRYSIWLQTNAAHRGIAPLPGQSFPFLPAIWHAIKFGQTHVHASPRQCPLNVCIAL